MKSKHAANRSRRPREGFFFALVRFAGLLLKVAGWLLLAIGVIGFIIMLVRIGPALAGPLQYPEQKMAGFVFILILVNLLIFPAVGLVGAGMVGIGFALGFIGTQPGEPTTIITTDQVSQPMEPPTQGAG